MATIYRGATPTITCPVTDEDGNAIDLTGYTVFFSIGKPGRDMLTVSNDQMTLGGEGNNVASFTLTQEQTLGLRKGDAQMQIRAIDADAALVTNAEALTIADIIHDGEIEDVTD